MELWKWVDSSATENYQKNSVSHGNFLEGTWCFMMKIDGIQTIGTPHRDLRRGTLGCQLQCALLVREISRFIKAQPAR